MSDEADVTPFHLDLRKHMARTATTAAYPFSGSGSVQALMYVALGLAGEAGEIANQVKKIARDDGGFLTAERQRKIDDELGDVGWYWLRMCYELHLDPYEVLERNKNKLAQRAADGMINGDRRNGSLKRASEREWEADLAEAAGKEDVFAVPREGLRALIKNGVLPEVDGKSPGFFITCRSKRCVGWAVEDYRSRDYEALHETGLEHVMREHTPWGRAGRD